MIWQAFLLASLLPIHTYAVYIQSRYYQNCAPMSKTIVCFGGVLGGTEDTSGQIYKIDLQTVGSIQSNNLTSAWATLNPTPTEGNPGIEPRHSSIVQNLGDLRILISGDGVGANLTYPITKMQNESIIYHTETNTITTLPAFRNVLDASGVYVKSLQFLYVYGGSMDTNLTIPGYPIITRLNLTFPFSWNEVQGASNAPVFNSNYILRGQAAVLSPKNLIYFLGGRFTQDRQSVRTNAPNFQTPYIFDTQQSIWLPQVTMGGSSGNIPANRYGHSATLLPNSSRIFIFGGARTTNDQNDNTNFAFILDLDTNSYTQVNLSTSPSGLTSRYGHSAVLIDSSLFIMFGNLGGTKFTSNIDVIDVSNTDPSAIRWSSVYPPEDQPDVSSSKKSNTGTIAGATVGSVVGVGIIAGALVFFIRKKKKEDKKKGFDDYSNIDYSHEATYETSPRPMAYTAEVPDMQGSNNIPPVYYASKPEDLEGYNEENFLRPLHQQNHSNIKPDEADYGNNNDHNDHYQKPNRYEIN